ncbi:hypothetical protein AB0M46_08090 [Dactylosporangium sp. NPDC051485]|uniref:hypothetical protein n=1 Tax=Dactylosporangium sp. NPDC051485 TaxID=3154846 RepID=UPI00342CF088
MTRNRIGLAVGAAVLTGAGVVGIPATAIAQPSPAPPGGGTATTAPAPGYGAQDHHHGGMLSGVEHGEGVVQTDKGQVNVAMQVGTLTSATGSAVTVKSADGWTRTWNLGSNLRVFEQRHTLQPNALTAGTKIVIAGTTSGAGTGAETYTAQFIKVHQHGGMRQPAPATPSPGGMTPSPAPTGT